MSDLCSAQHWVYMLTCDEYEDIYAAQNGRCGVCGLLERETTSRQFKIDHEHGRATGYWAVRGLLCGSCNGRLRVRSDVPQTHEMQRYLRNAWWLSLPPVMDEPPVGTVLRGRWGGRWERCADHWLGPKRNISEWRWAVFSAGPYLRIIQDASGQTYDAPLLKKTRRPTADCLSRRMSIDPDVTPERMSRTALIAEVRKLRQLLAAGSALGAVGDLRADDAA